MSLFNRKTLQRHIRPAPIPADHLAALEAWAEMIDSSRIHTMKEVALHGQFASKIIEDVLGYHGPAGGAEYKGRSAQDSKSRRRAAACKYRRAAANGAFGFSAPCGRCRPEH